MSYLNNGQAPDLQAILATLASFAPPVQQEVPTSPVGGYDPVPNEQDHQPPPPKASDPRIKPQGCSAASSKPLVDPATITTWQDGLRCVTKIAAQNAQFAASIRKMMDNQRQNEMRWYAERQALKQSQASRERAAAETSQIWRTLGEGEEVAPAAIRSMDEELKTFDRKIYAAQLQMDAAMSEELKGLGVPFFGTDPGAIAGEESVKSAMQAANSRPKHSPFVTEKELLTLRRRMVEHLEALYRD